MTRRRRRRPRPSLGPAQRQRCGGKLLPSISPRRVGDGFSGCFAWRRANSRRVGNGGAPGLLLVRCGDGGTSGSLSPLFSRGALATTLAAVWPGEALPRRRNSAARWRRQRLWPSLDEARRRMRYVRKPLPPFSRRASAMASAAVWHGGAPRRRCSLLGARALPSPGLLAARQRRRVTVRTPGPLPLTKMASRQP